MWWLRLFFSLSKAWFLAPEQRQTKGSCIVLGKRTTEDTTRGRVQNSIKRNCNMFYTVSSTLAQFKIILEHRDWRSIRELINYVSDSVG